MTHTHTKCLSNSLKNHLRQDIKPRRDGKLHRSSKEKEVLLGWVAREGSIKELRHEEGLEREEGRTGKSIPGRWNNMN